MSAARYALFRVDEAQPHTKNWRPQILAFVNVVRNDDENTFTLRHPKLLNYLYQLKAGRGLVVTASILQGDFIENHQHIEPVRSVRLRSSGFFFIETKLVNFFFSSSRV